MTASNDLCPCGHLMLWHDVEEYSGDGTELCCWPDCTQAGCPGRKAKS